MSCARLRLSFATQAEELYSIAEARHKTLLIAHKTAYCPAFRHLVTMLKSGVIGKIVDINASVTTLTDEKSSKLNAQSVRRQHERERMLSSAADHQASGTGSAQHQLLLDHEERRGHVHQGCVPLRQCHSVIPGRPWSEDGREYGHLRNKGYIYVPAPWWKTDYFEQRFEDQNLNRKCFFPFMGEGTRYEIREFISRILNPNQSMYLLQRMRSSR